MKTTILRASFLVLSATLLASIAGATAAACGDTTLDQYIALGATGCTIGDKTFSNFAYTPTGVTPQASSVNVAPDLSNPSDPGLNFGAIWSVTNGVGGAGSAVSKDFHLSFTIDVNPGGNPIDDDSLGIDFGKIVGSGSEVDVNETVCLGGNFTGNPNNGQNCQGTAQSFLGVFHDTFSNQLFDHEVFSGGATYTHAEVFKDIGLTTGDNLGDKANFSSLSQNFSETSVPEPMTLSLMGVGLLGLGLLRKRVG